MDVWSHCNFLHVQFDRLEMVGLRVPCYERNKNTEVVKIPDYWQKLGEIFVRVSNRNILFAGDFNTDPQQVFGNRQEKAIIEGSLGKMIIPDPVGEWSFRRNESSARIDHVAHTGSISVSNPRYIATIGDLILAGVPGAMSDHAALLFEVECEDTKI